MHHFGGTIFACDLRELQPSNVTFHPASSDGKEAAYVTVAYPNGAELHHNRPQHLRPKDPLVGGRGSIQIMGDGQRRAPKPVPVYKGTGGIYGDFIECVKTRERPFRDIELAVNTMTAPHMIAIAYRLQRSLNWNVASQQFIDDAEANRLCDRARREPWIL